MSEERLTFLGAPIFFDEERLVASEPCAVCGSSSRVCEGCYSEHGANLRREAEEVREVNGLLTKRLEDLYDRFLATAGLLEHAERERDEARGVARRLLPMQNASDFVDDEFLARFPWLLASPSREIPE